MGRRPRTQRIVRGIVLKAGQVVYAIRQDPADSWPSNTYLSVTQFRESLVAATLPTGSVWERVCYYGKPNLVQVAGPESPYPGIEHPQPQAAVPIDNLPAQPARQDPKTRHVYR